MRIRLFLALSLMFCALNAQTDDNDQTPQEPQAYVVYEYDASGNRTQRRIEIVGVTDDENRSSEVDPEEELRPMPSMAVYPNPSDGLLYLELSGLEETMARIRLVDMNGRIILDEQRPLTGQNTLQLFAIPDGQYSLQIQSESINKTWNIVKH